MLSGHIDDYIVAIKAKYPKNGINRNKALSHLEDAKAHLTVLELYESRPATDSTNQLFDKGDIGNCTCPHPGVFAVDCPIHKA